MKNKKFFVVFVSCLLSCQSFGGKNITVKGNVTSRRTGNRLSVLPWCKTIRNQQGLLQTWTVTFTISVPKNASLAISYIGYKEVIIAAKPSLKIVMEEDSKMIDEVVVTGYMAEKKASLTGSVAVVKMKEVADIPTGNVMSGLQGRVAGMNVTTDGKPGGGNTDTKLRGITTINNSSLFM